MQKALQYGKQQENNRQIALAYNRLCRAESMNKNFDEAIEYGKKAFDLAVAEQALPIELETCTFLADAYGGVGNYKEAFAFSQLAKRLGDTLSKQQYDARTASLQKAFEVHEKDAEIELLNKDKQLQQEHIRSQRITMAGSLIIAVLLIAGLVMLFVRFRLRQRMKAMEMRNNIAADLHDEVGSSLSSIHLLSQMAALKSPQSGDQLEVLQRMSNNARETMEKMSDIVWMIKPSENDGASLGERIERFLYELCSSRNINGSLTGAELLENIRLSMDQRRELYLLIKEALNNAAKYSEGNTIMIKIARHEQNLLVEITDNGKGFNPAQTTTGNGLANMRQRAKKLNGELMLKSESGTGTSISLVIPFHRAASIR